MMNILLTIQYIALALMLVSFIQLIRIQFLSKVVRKAIYETFENRTANRDSYQKFPYPDIDATYASLKWYKPWQRPSTLLVYDKEA